MYVANKVSQNYLHIKALLHHQLCDDTISLSEDIFAYIDLMAETYFVSFVYVQKFIGHTQWMVMNLWWHPLLLELVNM